MIRIKTPEDYERYYKQSVEDPEGFWAEQAESFVWKKKWDKVVDWNFSEPNIKWFTNAKLNITENCLDRHLEERGDQTAILWVPNEPTDEAIEYTYKELHAEVCRVSNMMKAKGIGKGDRVCFYMPMVAELAIAVLACAKQMYLRLGALVWGIP